jgi:hypothetical protein
MKFPSRWIPSPLEKNKYGREVGDLMVVLSSTLKAEVLDIY